MSQKGTGERGERSRGGMWAVMHCCTYGCALGPVCVFSELLRLSIQHPTNIML